jgi:hypothetical protein
VRALVQTAATGVATAWLGTPQPLPEWRSEPVTQASQIG